MNKELPDKEERDKVNNIIKNNEADLNIKSIENNWPQIIKNFQIQVKLHKIKFDCLKEAGFSEKEALELCKTL